MSTLPLRHVKDPEKRLMILYAMSKLGKCDELQLLKFLVEYDLSNYIDLMLTLYELCSQGQAVRLKGDGFDDYSLTEAGLEAVNLFKNRLPESTVRLIDEHADEWTDLFRRQRQYKAKWAPCDRGELNVTLSLQERDLGAPELKIELLVPNHVIADKMCKNWEKQSGFLYQTIIRALSEEA